MQKVYFCAGNTFLTGDAIAEAVLSYAGSLARTAEFDIVHVPTRRPDGSSGSTTLMLSPASQISSEAVDSVGADPEDAELVATLLSRRSHLLAPHPPAFELAEDPWLPADLRDL